MRWRGARDSAADHRLATGRFKRRAVETFYLQIRGVHIGAVLLSGALFLLRTTSQNLFGARWPASLPARILSWTIDTILLTAALMLMTIVRQYPFSDAWLTVKVILLACYIVLGWLALRARRRPARLAASALALGAFGAIVTVARSREPLGLLALI